MSAGQDRYERDKAMRKLAEEARDADARMQALFVACLTEFLEGKASFEIYDPKTGDASFVSFRRGPPNDH